MNTILDTEDLKKTDTWELFEKGRNYNRFKHLYTDTDLNYRMYNGNQWEGANIGGIEKAQYNFIETIVNYKVSTINQNLYKIHFSSENYEQKQFRKNAKRVCDLLDKKASQVWEKDQLDTKIRQVSEDAAINDEGLLWIWFDEETQSPVNEIINKNDVIYGNEQSSDIQSQPYIIVSKRIPVLTARNIAAKEGVSEEKQQFIVGDNETYDQTGDDSKIEKDDDVTIVYKLWKTKGIVWYSMSSKYVDLTKPKETKLHKYTLAHYLWKEKKGSSRGEGEVRTLIPNQLELNKSLARMLLSIKMNAYPTKVVAFDKVINPSAIDQVGGTIKVKGNTIEDVNKIFTTIAPAQMSTDVSKVMSDLINITRELKNAGDIATGGVNPEDASGKAILAVQQAAQQPMTKQSIGLKQFVEDVARIWLDMWMVYTPNGMKLEEEKFDENNEKYIEIVNVPSSMLENLKGNVKIDITPTSPYDKYARELSLENLLKNGYFNIEKLPELKVYAKILPDDAAMDKMALEDAIEYMEEEQQKIALMDAQAQMMQQRAAQFLNSDETMQSSMINDAAQMNQEQTQM